VWSESLLPLRSWLIGKIYAPSARFWSTAISAFIRIVGALNPVLGYIRGRTCPSVRVENGNKIPLEKTMVPLKEEDADRILKSIGLGGYRILLIASIWFGHVFLDSRYVRKEKYETDVESLKQTIHRLELKIEGLAQ